MPDPDVDVSAAIVRLARRHRYLAGVLLGELGLHPGQETVLQLLAQAGGSSQAGLADALGVAPPTVHRTVASLERRGLVVRARAPHDRRADVVELTDRGRELLPRVASAWAELERRTVAGLDDADRVELHRLLVRVAVSLDPVDR